TLGVINLYLKEGHIRERAEESFLTAIANTLAEIIYRKQIEKEKDAISQRLLNSLPRARLPQ
ncbi:MAG: hypothetical protein ABIF01_01335, partial [Candidatus Micrarchaeota archaeon]